MEDSPIIRNSDNTRHLGVKDIKRGFVVNYHRSRQTYSRYSICRFYNIRRRDFNTFIAKYRKAVEIYYNTDKEIIIIVATKIPRTRINDIHTYKLLKELLGLN